MKCGGDFKYRKKYSIVKNIFADNFLEQAKKQSDIILFKEDFLTFISYAEFLYFFEEDNLNRLKEYYQDSILEKIFSKDIKFFDIEHYSNFRNFFKILNKETAQEINLSNVSREIGLSVMTVKRYMKILEKMYLHKILYKEEKSIRKQIKSFKKGYVQSLNLLNVSLGTDFWSMGKEDFGHIIETFVFNEFQKNGLEEITFYHDTKKKKEIDFILKNGKTILPIEVKITSQIKSKHLRNLLQFAQKNNLQRVVIIYGGSEIKQEKINGVKIEFLPYWIV